jgi:cytochrome c peroxidase
MLVPAILPACADRPQEQSPPTAEAAANLVAEARVAPPTAASAGRAIYFDQNLAINRNQSCEACHGEAWGYTGPETSVNAHGGVYEGSISGRFGNRKPPSAAYATTSPVFHYDTTRKQYVGGNFWDGRATGKRLGNPAAEQAQGPPLNPVEQALRDEACAVYRVRGSGAAAEYRGAFGRGIDRIRFPADIEALCNTEGAKLSLPAEVRRQVEAEWDNIARAVAAFEGSPEVNQFSSKYDAYLAGKATLSAEERRGLELFQGKARCTTCHTSTGRKPLFTDYTYDNIGVPPNPENPVYQRDPTFRDEGLGGFLKKSPVLAVGGWEGEVGKMKVPTLRNVNRRPTPDAPKAFMHNGVFKSLEEVVHFYNTRDVLPRCGASAERSEWGTRCWPAPETPQNMNTTDLGRMGLSPEDEAALVAFLGTLSDGWMQPARPPVRP